MTAGQCWMQIPDTAPRHQSSWPQERAPCIPQIIVGSTCGSSASSETHPDPNRNSEEMVSASYSTKQLENKRESSLYGSFLSLLSALWTPNPGTADSHRCEVPSNLQPQVRLFLLNPLHPNKKEIRIKTIPLQTDNTNPPQYSFNICLSDLSPLILCSSGFLPWAPRNYFSEPCDLKEQNKLMP